MNIDEIGIRIAIGLGCFCAGFIIGIIVMFCKDE
jgi:F0F1-type ATP synthase membrane subunit c/vacuolar-type H+-ATPase subunit K